MSDIDLTDATATGWLNVGTSRAHFFADGVSARALCGGIYRVVAAVTTPLACCKACTRRRRAMGDPHAYLGACRNTQHAGCTCMHPVDGRWCGKDRNHPIHRQQEGQADD